MATDTFPFQVVNPGENPNPTYDPDFLAAGPGPYYVVDPAHSSPFKTDDVGRALSEAVRYNGRLVGRLQIAPELR